MSAGHIHTRASLILASSFLASSIFWGGGVEPALGALIGVLVGPDLDVDHGNNSDAYIRKSVGYVLEWVWDLLWWPYRKMFKHGSFASHFPIISTWGRIAYLYFVMMFVYAILGMFFPGAWDMRVEFAWWWDLIAHHPRVVYGLIGADTIHFFLDILTTSHEESKSPA
jgi:uncharacterized metal-binding protein